MQLLNEKILDACESYFSQEVAASLSESIERVSEFASCCYIESRLQNKSGQVDFLTRIARGDAPELLNFIRESNLSEPLSWFEDILKQWVCLTHPFRNKLDSIWLEWDNLSSLNPHNFGISFTFHEEMRDNKEQILNWLEAHIPNKFLKHEQLKQYLSTDTDLCLIHFSLMIQRDTFDNKFYTAVKFEGIDDFFQILGWKNMPAVNTLIQEFNRASIPNTAFFDINLSDVGKLQPFRTSLNTKVNEQLIESCKKNKLLNKNDINFFSSWHVDNEAQSYETFSKFQSRWLELKWVFISGAVSEVKCYWGFHKPYRKLFRA